MKTKLIAAGCLTLVFSMVFPAAAADEKIEQAVRDADEQWSKAAVAKDLDKTVSFYAADALVLPPTHPAITTKDEIRNLWKWFFDSLASINWTTTRVEAAKSGDMAYLTGIYEMTMKDGTKDHGKFLDVWKKQADGSWKVVVDMVNSDLPATPAEKK